MYRSNKDTEKQTVKEHFIQIILIQANNHTLKCPFVKYKEKNNNSKINTKKSYNNYRFYSQKREKKIFAELQKPFNQNTELADLYTVS